METKKCPYCGEEILAVAKKCKHCGTWLEKDPVSANTSTEPLKELSTEASELQPEQRQPKLNKLIPVIVTVVFTIAVVFFHFNYSYTDWWVDEELIVVPAIIGFAVLMMCYYIIMRKKVSTNKKTEKPTNKRNGILAKYKKHLGIGGIALLILGGGFVYYADKVAKEKVAIEAHKYQVEQFEENARQIKTKATAIRKLSRLIFVDLYNNWRSAIFDHKAYDADNKRKSCRDFNDAITWRHDFYTKQKAYDKLNEWNKDILNLMKEMKNPPEEKYKEWTDKLTPVYAKAEEVVSFCTSPHGSLRSFSDKYEELLAELDAAIKGTDLVVEDVEGEGSSLYYEALTSEMSDYINEVLSK